MINSGFGGSEVKGGRFGGFSPISAPKSTLQRGPPAGTTFPGIWSSKWHRMYIRISFRTKYTRNYVSITHQLLNLTVRPPQVFKCTTFCNVALIGQLQARDLIEELLFSGYAKLVFFPKYTQFPESLPKESVLKSF